MSNYNLPSGATAREIETVGDITCIGYSSIGDLSTAETWSIKKIETVGDAVSITYADGAWSDRLTLTYK